MSRIKVTHIHLLVMSCLLTTAAADWWDDFSNNLATDLSPLLALFGEQVTMQFLSESTSWLDNFIFAMAPLGIVTAVVSAIRLRGGPGLRAFIGRAQEGGGIAEAELCSSTSGDVCELYHNGAIVRVFGRPKILEVVHNPRTAEFYYGQKDGQLRKPSCGIHTFRQYVRKRMREENEWEEVGAFEKPRKTPSDVESTASDSSAVDHENSDNFAPNPNLSFNIGIKRRAPSKYWAAAASGLLLQTWVIVFGSLATHYWKWVKDGAPPQVWAFPLMATGTVLLSGGMFCCAFIIEKSTKEREFRRVEKRKEPSHPSASVGERDSVEDATKEGAERTVIYIVQPGNQNIGDQTYDPFAFSDASDSTRLTHYITSRKVEPKDGDDRKVWVSIGLTLVGFALQFTGLRAMHSSVSIVLLAAIMLMSIIRSSIRTERLKKDENLLKARPDQVEGHELDWTAMEMGQPGKMLGSWSAVWNLAFQPISATKGPSDTTNFQYGDSTNPQKLSNSVPWKILEAREGQKVLICGFMQPMEAAETHKPMIDSDPRLAEASWLSRTRQNRHLNGKDEENPAEKAFYYRTRLAELTSQSIIKKKSKSSGQWDNHVVPIRRQAVQLKKAIETSAQILFADAKFKSNLNWKAAKSLAWSFDVAVPSVSESDPKPKPATQQVYLFLRQKNSECNTPTWEIDQDSLESVLGLWVWSITSDTIVEDKDKAGSYSSKAPEIPRARIIATKRDKEGIKSAAIEMEHWSNDHIASATTKEWSFTSKETYLGAQSIWEKSNHDGTWNLKGGLSIRFPKEQNVRLFGWPSVRLYDQTLVLATDVEQSIPDLCAQDIYQSFIGTMATILTSIGGNTTHDDNNSGASLHNDVLSRLARTLTENDLGSLQDAYSILIPVLSCQSKLPLATEALPQVYRKARYSRLAGQFGEAETNLKWAWDICVQTYNLHNEDSILCSAILELAEFYRYAFRASLFEKNTHKSEQFLQIGRGGELWLKARKEGMDLETASLHQVAEVAERYVQLLEEWHKEGNQSRSTAADVLQAIRKDDRVQCLLHISRAEKIEFSDNDSRTVLSWAASRGWPEVVKACLEIGSTVDSEDTQKRTPLSYAAENGHEEVVRILMDNKALPIAMDTDRRTPLSYASQKGHAHIIKILAKGRPWAPNSQDIHGHTALYWACLHGGWTAVEALLLAGADMNEIDGGSKLPLMLTALTNGRLAMAKKLKEMGAEWNVNIDGQEAWKWAFSNGFWPAGLFLLKLWNQSTQSFGLTRKVTAFYSPKDGDPGLRPTHLDSSSSEGTPDFRIEIWQEIEIQFRPDKRVEILQDESIQDLREHLTRKIMNGYYRPRIWVEDFRGRKSEPGFWLEAPVICRFGEEVKSLVTLIELPWSSFKAWCLEQVLLPGNFRLTRDEFGSMCSTLRSRPVSPTDLDGNDIEVEMNVMDAFSYESEILQLEKRPKEFGWLAWELGGGFLLLSDEVNQFARRPPNNVEAIGRFIREHIKDENGVFPELSPEKQDQLRDQLRSELADAVMDMPRRIKRAKSPKKRRKHQNQLARDQDSF